MPSNSALVARLLVSGILGLPLKSLYEPVVATLANPVISAVLCLWDVLALLASCVSIPARAVSNPSLVIKLLSAAFIS